MATVIRNADVVVAWDASERQHTYLTGGDVAYDGGTLTFVGRNYAGPAEEEIDGRGLLVMPGLVNIHSHPSSEPMNKGLIDEIGWAAVLPQLLASLGAVFAIAGVGDAVGGLIGHAIPAGSVAGAAIAYGLGMALFTIVMGNAFAAFPVMAAAVGIPLLVKGYGGDPAAVAAVGMLAGFCGTLLTPMAANFNIVPAALLELKDRYGVIRAQAPTALVLLAFNIVLLWWVVR